MASLAKALSGKLTDLLRAPAGVNNNLAALAQAGNEEVAHLEEIQITSQNMAAELADRSAGAKYPSVQIYCEKLTNDLREKFRTFSGTARMIVEVRLSQDRLEGIEPKLQLYVDAVTGVLDGNRGNWGGGMYYAGGYEATFGPVKHGGRNFMQAAKVSFEVEVSRS